MTLERKLYLLTTTERVQQFKDSISQTRGLVIVMH